jgi:signal transduction histidine kinase
MLDAAERDVEVEMQPGLPALLVDRARVAQSLQNLMRQALKMHGGGKGHLRLRARKTVALGKPMVRFDVIDPSRDLSETDVQHAFDPDPDLPRSAARSLALGLALGLARDLTRLHGGEAGCENLGGACWFLLLPVEQGPRGDAPLRARHEKDAPRRPDNEKR